MSLTGPTGQRTSMGVTEPKWRRRAPERPTEIAGAALAVFAERGYAAARLSDIAARAGVSKAALYLYYPTKADLFRAVLLQRSAPQVASVFGPGGAPADLLDQVLPALAQALARPELRKLARMVIAESGNFPELARTWHDEVVAPALAGMGRLIADGQKAGAVRPGDPRLLAITVIGPLLTGALWREVMEPVGGAPVDLADLAREHAVTLAAGLLPR